MKRKRFSVEQIVAAVKQHDLGVSATDIARKLGVAEQTFYRWKKQYGGLGDAAGERLKNDRRIATPVGSAPPAAALRRKIRELAHRRIRYGYKRVHILLRREGIHVNKKRVYRLYCEEGLQFRARRRRRPVTASSRRPPRTRPQVPNVAWSMDFVSDQTASGKRFRALTVVDLFTRECLAVEPGQSLGGVDGVNVLRRIAAVRGAPKRLHCDNGSEFAGRLVDLWAYANGVTMQFSRPGKPMD